MKLKKTLALIPVAIVLVVGIAFATSTIMNRDDASFSNETSYVDFSKLNDTEKNDPFVEETETSTEETTNSATTTATAPAPATTKPINKIDGEADILKTNTEIKNSGVTDTTSSVPVVIYHEKEATVSVNTPPAPPAPAEKKSEKASETTASSTTTSSETVRFDNNEPVHFVENPDSQEVITEEVMEIEEEKVSDELADLFG